MVMMVKILKRLSKVAAVSEKVILDGVDLEHSITSINYCKKSMNIIEISPKVLFGPKGSDRKQV